MVLDRTYEPGMAVLVAVGVGVLVDHVLAAGSPRHLAIAIVVAYVTALGLIAGRVCYLLHQERGGRRRLSSGRAPHT